jgi:hypothetical protein
MSLLEFKIIINITMKILTDAYSSFLIKGKQREAGTTDYYQVLIAKDLDTNANTAVNE